MKRAARIDLIAAATIVVLGFVAAVGAGTGLNTWVAASGALAVYYIGLRLIAGVAKGLFGRARRHDFRTWHPGQLAIVWVAIAIIDRLLLALIRYDWEMHDNHVLAAICALIALTLIGTLLWVSWEWFGSRRALSG